MDQHRLHATNTPRAEGLTIDLGIDPPLSVDGDGLIDRRRVSVQWFSGTILTGLCGAALMGGAVFASLDGETNFASLPERLEAGLHGPAGADRSAAALRKADKLAAFAEPAVARQVIRVSTATRSGSGDREVMRVRPLVRVAGNLSLSVSQLSANIPPFNPQRMLADSSGAATPADDATAAAPDAEVSFVTRDLAAALPRAKMGATLGLEDVLMRVREAANWTGSVRPVGPMAAGPIRFAYAVEGDTASDPYAGFEPRIIPENITMLRKTSAQATGGNAWNERVVVVKKGDTVTSILRDLGATPDEAQAVAAKLGARGRDGGLKEGLKLRVLLAATGPAGPAQRLQPVRVIVANDNAAEAVVALSDMGKYVPVDVGSINTSTEVAEASDDDEEDDGSGVRLYQSIYETALRNQVPRPVIDDLIRIYSYDVDFQRKVHPGDSFEVLYNGDEEGQSSDGKNDVVFAELTVGGEQKKYYRFQTPDDSVVDYYDESGKSAKKFLVRKPVADAVMRSGFGVRRHPVLGYTKMHTGVDWAAPPGTPIYASGNGTIEKVGWEGGYGKYIRIRHNNGYETAYGHMLAFARGMEPGVRVRQGQVIGFVGSTGLSTGPHCHYEILVNGRFVDPMRIKLPRGRVLEGPILAQFEKSRDQVDGTMTRNAPPPRVAQNQG